MTHLDRPQDSDKVSSDPRLDFYTRGEQAWLQYLLTGHATPIDTVFARIEQRIDARRRSLLGDSEGASS